jgi:hypothetical protein
MLKLLSMHYVQVESFLLALQPLLQAAGHSVAALQLNKLQQQPSSASSSTPHTGLLAPLQQLAVSEQPEQQQQPDKQHQQLQQQQQHVHAGQPLHQSPVPVQAPSSPHSQQQQQQHGLDLQQPAAPLSLHIVDFGCGTGNLLLPLAALLPGCRFTGVDMKPAALQLLQTRAAAAGLANVSVFEGMIEQFRQPFDVGLALHACGNATDHVLQMSVEQRAAFVVSPCCVGEVAHGPCWKLSHSISITSISNLEPLQLLWLHLCPPNAGHLTQTTLHHQPRLGPTCCAVCQLQGRPDPLH